MLGAIIGDIVGSRWEFNPTNDYNFELFSDKNSFTDDTICTVAVADALLHGSDDYGKFIHEWCRRYPHPMGGYGGRFAKWVMSNNPQPYGSYGNGSAMRVSPIGWWFGHPHDLYAEAEKAAACTHNHEEGILGAQAVAFAILDARELKHHVDVLYLCRQGLIVQMILHTIHPDILTGKQIQTRHRRINGLRAIVKHGIDIEARYFPPVMVYIIPSYT